MPSHRLATILATALAPCLWGTTYIVFTQTLPVSHPLLVGALRALPAGILLMLLGPGLPPRDKLGRLALVGLANIGVFFALLFVAAARLPGGVAATVTSVQPLLVGLLAWPVLRRRPRPVQLAAALAGSLGVGLLILGPAARLDAIGVAAALGAAASMATGTVLIERWAASARRWPWPPGSWRWAGWCCCRWPWRWRGCRPCPRCAMPPALPT